MAALAQYNTDRLLIIGRNALYFEDYVLSMQYFNQAINSKPYLYEPWFYRAVAKYNLDDFTGARLTARRPSASTPSSQTSTNSEDWHAYNRRNTTTPSTTTTRH